MIWLLEYMKIINLLYRGGAGGEFFGGLLVKHPEIATKELQHDPKKERWHLERDDLISSHFEMNAKTPNWDKNLWNLRLDHGYGFSKQPEFWIDYLWNNWKETRTVIFKSRTEASLEYTQKLAQLKLGLKPDDEDSNIMKGLIESNLFNVEQFWNRPWESDAYYFNMFMEMIPEDHDCLIIDPCELLHSNKVISRDTLEEVIDYIGIDNSLCDEWEETIESYRVKNKTLINNTII